MNDTGTLLLFYSVPLNDAMKKEVGRMVIFTFICLCFKGFAFFIKLHSNSEVVKLDVLFEVMVRRGYNMNVQ